MSEIDVSMSIFYECIERENNELKQELEVYRKSTGANISKSLYEKLKKIEELAQENKDTAQYQGICQSILQIINGEIS